MNRKQYTLSESIVTLESILEKAEMNRNRLGYFAAFVLKYAQRLNAEEDTSDTYRLLSAQLIGDYVDHYQNYEVMNEPVKSWMAAFDQSSSWWATISQQYIMSMICYVRITSAKSVLKVYDDQGDFEALRTAYHKAMQLLREEWESVLSRLSVYSSYLNRMKKSKDYASLGLNDFLSLENETIHFISDLLESTPGERQRKLNLLDYEVHATVEKVSMPNDINRLRMKIIRLSERKSIKDIIALILK